MGNKWENYIKIHKLMGKQLHISTWAIRKITKANGLSCPLQVNVSRAGIARSEMHLSSSIHMLSTGRTQAASAARYIPTRA
jgi:hypothetical protein